MGGSRLAGRGSGGSGTMARIAGHLSVEELEARYRAARDATEARHVQAIWLLAQGRTVLEVSEVLAFASRRVTRLAARYNASGPEVLGDGRRRNGRAASLLTPDLLAALAERVRTPPEDGGRWSGPKVAAWMAAHPGLAKVHPQRGWEALKRIKWSVQAPRGRGMRAPPRPSSGRPSRGARGGGRPGQDGAPRSAGRGLGRRRASPRPEAGPAPGLGPRRPAAGRARAPPLPLAARRRLRAADQRRGRVVPLDRPVEAFLRGAARRGAARRLRAGDRRRARAPHRARARQRRLAWPGGPRRPRRDQPGVPAALHPGAAAGRASLAFGRRARRRPALRHARRPRGRRRRALRAARGRRHQTTHRFPPVAQAGYPDLISRRWYDTGGGGAAGRHGAAG